MRSYRRYPPRPGKLEWAVAAAIVLVAAALIVSLTVIGETLKGLL